MILANPSMTTNHLITQAPQITSAISNQYQKTPEQQYNEDLMQKNYDMSLKYAEDYYTSAVKGMQNAGLNPALMYNSGTSAVSYHGSAPYNATDTQSTRNYQKTSANAQTINAASSLINSFGNLFGNLTSKSSYSLTNNFNKNYWRK